MIASIRSINSRRFCCHWVTTIGFRLDRSHQFQQVGVPARVIHEGPNHGFQGLAGRSQFVGVEKPLELVHDVLKTLVEQGQVEIFLALEIDVDGALPDSGRGSHVAQQNLVERSARQTARRPPR